MKKVFMSMAVVAAMFAAASCACNNNTEKAGECAATECADCTECDKACEASCDAACDTACVKECDKACDKACDQKCDKACDKECHKDKDCNKECGEHKCAKCDSTKVDCKKAE